MKARLGWALFLGIGVAVHAALGLSSIRAQSPTFDEPLHLAAGYAYWQTREYRVNGYHHPPLSSMWGALPLFSLNPALDVQSPPWLGARWRDPRDQYGFAHEFLYHNESASHGALMTAGRAAMLAASCLFLLAFYALVSRVSGPVAGAAAFLLAVFSPSLLAHGTLVTTDYLFTAFFFLFFVCFGFWQSEEKDPPGRKGWAAAAGGCLGLAFCSKFSAVAVGPVLLLWLLGRKFRVRLVAAEIGLFLAAGAAAIAVTYQIVGLPVFFDGLAYTLKRVQSGRSSFLWGNHSTEGWWYYFPLVFLWKTPIPVLIGLAAVLWSAWKKRYRISWYWFLPPAVYFILACSSSVQIGHRHILPVYPFLFALIGQWVQANWKAGAARIVVLVLGLFLAADTVLARPYFLSYFNPLVDRDKPYRYLTDSNVDWGQGLQALAEFMKERNVSGIYLSYFGTAEPHAYGIRHVSAAPYTLPGFSDDALDLRTEPKAYLAVSATNLMNTYYADHRLFSWLWDREPEAFLAGSILVFDITRDAESHRRLEDIFSRMGKQGAARIERAWAESLEEKAPR